MMNRLIFQTGKPTDPNPGYWWLSFSMPRHSAEPPYGFRGVVIVYAESMDDALNKSWALKLNPGGEVLAGLLDHTPEEKWANRLLNHKLIAVMGFGYKARGNN
jgi:hypothetical protein